ncbi:hypothetical protein BO94DRAFT_535060 [Aspergillus sclerotioniger CBS 115572]|uniref:Uncharacterized protein n=1 Tax=Aspergillus sclerotioniger CBS 115572 TaxID=1450535 RepID=A0A317WT00_9EURO|nr:hypothetical protein BO94DRAFT_535060 [Aspergillus sclerotioniger CBS 115572]PWY88048.1 hypothetical protein BO94DRAFT_535060 [Aspergillus sclerotioniger CBS 115572]
MMLSALRHWAPFQIDALGLVTMLGADDINLTVGRLVYSRFTEYLPVLGAFIIANNEMTKPIPGFVAYNITDGIMATDVTGWFSRWLLCQDFTTCSTTLRLVVQPKSNLVKRDAIGLFIGILSMAPVIIFPVIMGDWWGFVNSMSMLISIIVRKVIVHQNRTAISRSALQAYDTSSEAVKTFWTLPTGTVVTIYTPRGVLTNTLLTNPRPGHPRLYKLMRAIGWVGFGCHVISLGMTTLFNQIVTVAVLLVSTVIVVHRIGEDEHLIGENIAVSRHDDLEEQFRAATYARLELSEKEEQSMVLWNLFPHESNTAWWVRYRDCVQRGHGAFKGWDRKLTQQFTESEV